MALNCCEECSALFSIGAGPCPQCGSDTFHEDGAAPVPKAKPARVKKTG